MMSFLARRYVRRFREQEEKDEQLSLTLRDIDFPFLLSLLENQRTSRDCDSDLSLQLNEGTPDESKSLRENNTGDKQKGFHSKPTCGQKHSFITMETFHMLKVGCRHAGVTMGMNSL